MNSHLMGLTLEDSGKEQKQWQLARESGEHLWLTCVTQNFSSLAHSEMYQFWEWAEVRNGEHATATHQSKRKDWAQKYSTKRAQPPHVLELPLGPPALLWGHPQTPAEEQRTLKMYKVH